VNPLVSIVIPVYNGANYLKQAIDSALAQTYENCEVIVINDGSADNGVTEFIAKSYGDRIKYLYKANGGVATALNTGIRAARGDYISWLSHDDLYHASKIERQISFLSSLPSTKVVLYSDYEAVDAQNVLIHTIKLADADAADPRQVIIRLLFESTVHGCSLLLPKKCFTEVGYFDENLRTTQDYDLWFKLLKSGYEFRHMPEVLISSRWHDEQGTRTMYRIAHGEIESLYAGAIDMFYDDIEEMPVKIVVGLIVSFRARKFGKTANHLLRSIKLRNKRLHQLLYGQYRDILFASKVKSVTERPRQLLNLFANLIRTR